MDAITTATNQMIQSAQMVQLIAVTVLSGIVLGWLAVLRMKALNDE
jgi:endonuclease V-like protein UPF0215 family